MVYCNLVEKHQEYAIYSVGTDAGDITGEAKFFNKFVQPLVIRQPKTGFVSNATLSKVAIKYRNVFLNGEFPNKISYEI